MEGMIELYVVSIEINDMFDFFPLKGERKSGIRNDGSAMNSPILLSQNYFDEQVSPQWRQRGRKWWVFEEE